MTSLILDFLKVQFAQGSPNSAFVSPVIRASQLVLGSILMLVSILAFAPLDPELPKADLDPSWIIAMNQAVAQGSVFGRDIIFTFGPYAAIYTKAYHPATYPWTLTLGLMFGLCYGAMLMMTLRNRSNVWLWLFTGFLLLVNSRDALFFSYPLLIVLTACMATLHDSDSKRLSISPRVRIDYAVAIAMLGALPIIKGSFLPLTLMAALAGLILYWKKGDRTFALLFIVLPALTMALLWHMAGQPITALPDYFRSMTPVISGFTEAMSIEGSTWQITAYISVAALMLASIWRNHSSSILHKTIMMSCVALFLFVAFKAGFVRHDGHALAAGSALLLCAFSLNIFGIARTGLLAAAFSIAVFAWFHFTYLGTSLNNTSIPSIRSVISGDHFGAGLHTAFTQRLAKINAESPIPKLGGTTDIYPYDQAALIASGNNWVSRPITQSYSAYTPTLARVNEAHLRGQHAPDNIVFRVATIDERYPSLDDGLSWPTLISRYAISAADKEYLYLKKRSTSLEVKQTLLAQGSYKLGKWVSLPQERRILFAEIDVQPTLLGRLATILFKPSTLYILVKLADGRSMTYRFIPSMARMGFVLSPLATTTTDFARIATGQLQSLEPNRISSIRIAPGGANTLSWEREYSLRISVLEVNSVAPLQ